MARTTTCTTITDAWDGVGAVFTGLGIVGVLAIISATIQAAIVTFSSAGWTPPSLIAAGIVLMAACVLAMAVTVRAGNYFFDHRLVCIEPSKCVIGRVILTEENEDGDRSLDLLLAPADESTTAAEYQTVLWQSRDRIFTDFVGLGTRGWHLNPKGNRGSTNPIGFGNNELPFFHCEIEGTKIANWLTAIMAWLIALMVIAAAAIALGAIGTAIPIVGAILMIALAIFWLLALIFGLDYGWGEGDAPSVDVDNLGDATPSDMGPVITDSTGNSVSNGDVVIVTGAFIVDTGHNPGCWNELHPIRGIAKMRGPKEYFSVGTDSQSDIFSRYCQALNDHINNFGTISQGLTKLEHPSLG